VHERNQRLDAQVAADLPTIQADAEKLRDIFTNLVSNAVRFSPDGGTIVVARHPGARRGRGSRRR
jgi:signal transduction histidine kinase